MSNQELKTFTCFWTSAGYPCSQTFSSAKELDTHLAFHINENIGAESHCHWLNCARKEPFKAKYQLNIHSKTHSGYKPFECDFCDMSFSRQENLKIHRRKHTGERPYVCPEPGCGASFSSSTDRRKHRYVHANEPIHCSYCPKTFFHPQSLRTHIKKTHEQECGATTSSTNKRKREATPEEQSLNSTISTTSDYYSSFAPTPPPAAKRVCQMPAMFPTAIPMQMWYSSMGYAEHIPTEYSATDYSGNNFQPHFYPSYFYPPQSTFPSFYQPNYQ